MKIGGLQPVTLLDYPQKVAAIIFTIGCNMRCPFCYNPSLVLSPKIKESNNLNEDDVFAFLKKRKKYLDGVVITGGEPTLQKDLAKFCRRLKKINYLIKLDTNGLLPDVLQNLIAENLVDYISMDVKSAPKKYDQISGVSADLEKIKQSIKTIKQSNLPYEFRTTVVNGYHTKDDLKEIAELIAGAERYYLQNFKKNNNLVGDNFTGRSFSAKSMEEFLAIFKDKVKVCECR